jgi:hypothetical protein
MNLLGENNTQKLQRKLTKLLSKNDEFSKFSAIETQKKENIKTLESDFSKSSERSTISEQS